MSPCPSPVRWPASVVALIAISAGAAVALAAGSANAATPSSSSVAPSIAVSPAAYTFTKGTPIAPIVPTLNSAVKSVSISPALDRDGGLALNSATGAISGTPRETLATTQYTLTAHSATNLTATASVTITVNDIAPTISVLGSPFSFLVGAPIETIVPTLGPGVESVAIKPCLTGTGLSLDTSNGRISGTPTAPLDATNFVLTASNGTGQTATALISLEFNAVKKAVAPTPSQGAACEYTLNIADFQSTNPNVTAPHVYADGAEILAGSDGYYHVPLTDSLGRPLTDTVPWESAPRAAWVVQRANGTIIAGNSGHQDGSDCDSDDSAGGGKGYVAYITAATVNCTVSSVTNYPGANGFEDQRDGIGIIGDAGDDQYTVKGNVIYAESTTTTAADLYVLKVAADLCRGVVCTAQDQCHQAGTCDALTGLCSNPEAADGSACDDHDACTQADTCEAGVCVGSNPVTCTAIDQCHAAGVCNAATGLCSNPNAANGTTCNDGNACTQTDTCQGGSCQGTSPVVCTASDQCHAAGVCNEGTGICSNPNAADGTMCNDGSACTSNDVCTAGICSGTAYSCAAPDQCHQAGACNGDGTCSFANKADGSTCNDGDACTATDACMSGACVGTGSPCENGGVCSASGASSYLCECTSGYSGSNCQVAPGPGAPGCGESTTWVDGSGGNHSGALAFSAAPYTGFTGSGTVTDPDAVTFDGIYDRIDLAAGTDGLRFSDAITTEFWTRVDQYSSTNENLYVNRNNVNEYSGSWIGLNAYDNETNHWSAGYSTDGSSWTEIWSDAPVQLGVWTHVALTYSTTNGSSLYINGVLQQKQLAASGPIYYASDAVPRLSEAPTYPYHGAIGLGRVWHAALGPDEIAALYAQSAGRFGLTAQQPVGSVDEPLALLLDAAQCAPAGAGAACAGSGDCNSGVCSNGLCEPGGAATSCNGATDCLSGSCGAGDQCSQSQQGGACATASDCATGTCISNLCVPGPVGSACANNTDCVTAVCASNGTCGQAATGSGCLSNGDCVTANCNLGSGNGNGNLGSGNGNGNGNGNSSSGVGVCEQAAPQGPCDLPGDCTSGVCTQGSSPSSGAASGACAAPTCSDSVQNGGETGVDCGGPCAQLATPQLCSAGVGCEAPGDCLSGVCNGGTCGQGAAGAPCGGAGDCTTGVCSGGICGQAVEYAPAITQSSQSATSAAGGATVFFSLAAGDGNLPPQDLTYSWTSSDGALGTPASTAGAGSGTSSVAWTAPACLKATGSTITATVSNGRLSASKTFTVTPAANAICAVACSGGLMSFTNATALISAGDQPLAAATGDLNRDGSLDIVTVSSSAQAVDVLLGNGSGGFAAPVRYSLQGLSPVALAIGDINGDGALDVAVAASNGSVLVFLNDGSGQLGTPSTYSTGKTSLSSLALGDLDGDGYADAVVAYETTSSSKGRVLYSYSLLSMRGSSSGGLGAATAIGGSVSNQSVRSLRLARLSGHAVYDLVVASQGTSSQAGQIGIYLNKNDGSGTFKGAQTFSTPTSVVSIATGDVTGDGLPDIAAASQETIQLYVNSSSGSFSAGRAITAGDTVSAVAIGDLNGDGLADVVASLSSPGTVDVFLNSRASPGTFTAGASASDGDNALALVVADANGDQKQDVIAVSGTDDTVTVLLGNGSGGFQGSSSANSYAVSTLPAALVVADMNGDGIPDVVTNDLKDLESPGDILVLLGNGDGTLRAPLSTAVGVNPHVLAVADFDQDGTLDVVTAGYNTGNVYVLLNSKSNEGTLTLAGTYTDLDYLGQVVAGDVNGDGFPDLVTMHYNNSSTTSLTVFLNKGDHTGSFFPGYSVPLGPGTFPAGIALLDFHHDGKADLAVGTDSSDDVTYTLTLFINDGTGNFPTSVSYPVGEYPSTLVTGDLDLDGTPDLALLSDADPGTVDVLLGAPGGDAFRSDNSYATLSYPGSLAFADFNGDGKPDLFLANGTSYALLYNAGDGTFPSAAQVYTAPSGTSIGGDTGEGGLSGLADLNGDGKPDLTFIDNNAETVDVVLGSAGQAPFGGVRVFDGAQSPYALVTGDVNGDGKLDLIATNANAPLVSVLLGNGDGTFQVETTYAVGGDPYFVAAGNLAGPGGVDVVTSSYDGNTVSVLINKRDGSGTFFPAVSYATDLRPEPVVLADVNNDGYLDIITGNQEAETISVLINNGDGTFAAARNYPTPSMNVTGLALADMNGDGYLDAVIAANGTYDTMVLLNQKDGTFNSANPIQSFGTDTFSVVAADFNGDGAPDVVVFGQISNSASIFLNPNNNTGAISNPTVIGPVATPESPALGDIDGDGRVDVAVVDSNGFQFLRSNGNGIFAAQLFQTPLDSAHSLAIGDFTGTGRKDLAIASPDVGIVVFTASCTQ